MATILNQIGQFVGKLIKETRNYVDTSIYENKADTVNEILVTIRDGVSSTTDTLSKMKNYIDNRNIFYPMISLSGELSIGEIDKKNYFFKDLIINKIQFTLGQAADADIIILVKIDGVTEATYIIPVGEVNHVENVLHSLNISNVITFEITQVGNIVKGSDLSISFIE